MNKQELHYIYDNDIQVIVRSLSDNSSYTLAYLNKRSPLGFMKEAYFYRDTKESTRGAGVTYIKDIHYVNDLTKSLYL